MSGLKSLAWVAPLTVLIWIYAEREQAFTQPNVGVPIEVVSNDSSRVVKLLRPRDGNLMVTITGPKNRVDLVQEMGTRAGNPPVKIEVDSRLGDGVQRVRATQVGNDARFVGNGVTVSSPQPEMLDVLIDPLVEMDAPVKAPQNLQLLHEPTFEPRVVRVRGPKSTLEDAHNQGRLIAYATLSDYPELQSAMAKTVVLKNVKLTLPFEDKYVTILPPAAVIATIDVAQPEEYPIDIMRVFLVSPPGLLNDFRVEYPPTLANVVVQGAKDRIDALKQPDALARVKATFEVSPNDVGGTKTAKLRYDLPQGVTVKKGPAEIDFQIVRRSTE